MKYSSCLSILTAAGVLLVASCVAAVALDAVAKTGINVRAGPGIRNEILGELSIGQAVSATECKKGWCYIQYAGSEGWVAKRFLIFTEESDAGDSGSVTTEAATPAPLPEPGACKPGYVWRQTIPEDHVCVRPARHTAAQRENAIARMRLDPASDAAPDACRSGFVWREAYEGDVVCVTPTRQEQVRRENASGPSLRAPVPQPAE